MFLFPSTSNSQSIKGLDKVGFTLIDLIHTNSIGHLESTGSQSEGGSSLNRNVTSKRVDI